MKPLVPGASQLCCVRDRRRGREEGRIKDIESKGGEGKGDGGKGVEDKGDERRGMAEGEEWGEGRERRAIRDRGVG